MQQRVDKEEWIIFTPLWVKISEEKEVRKIKLEVSVGSRKSQNWGDTVVSADSEPKLWVMENFGGFGMASSALRYHTGRRCA